MTQAAATNKQYGILIYDIPTDNMKLYMKVYNKIRRKAIMLNKSVYLLLWGWRASLKIVIDEAVRDTGQTLTADFIPFDGVANAHVDGLAKASLERDIKECLSRLTKKIDKVCSDSAETLRPKYYETVKEQLQTVQTLAVMFGFEGDIQGILESTRQAIKIQWDRAPASRIRDN